MSGASIARACSVYCEGDVLHYVQISGVYNDSKTFVDMPMKADPEDINSAFLNLSNPYDTNEIRSFLDAYFYEAGSDLDSWVPTDLLESPSFLEKVSKKYRDWASELNQLWLVLGRQVNESASLYPQRTSFVPRQYPMIVPGGRFRESYYWDSWWIVRGLLVCEMPLTAKYVILNLLDDIKNFGFIPNGGRIYYLDRSQPPLLSEMVVSWLDYVGWSSPNGTEFLRTAYPLLQKEYNWWMNEENHHFLELSDPLSPSTLYPLNVYHSNQTTPRPESYLADLETAEVNIDSVEWETISPSQAELYRNIRTGAETGWDFSSRWFQPILLSSSSSSTFSSSSSSPDEAVYQYNLSSIDTTHIVPVDLNSFMYRFELNLANFARHIGNDSMADSYQSAASLRREGINQILWNQSTSRSVLAFPTLLRLTLLPHCPLSVLLDGMTSTSLPTLRSLPMVPLTPLLSPPSSRSGLDSFRPMTAQPHSRSLS
jgi:alpha,alpha-trehalase